MLFCLFRRLKTFLMTSQPSNISQRTASADQVCHHLFTDPSEQPGGNIRRSKIIKRSVLSSPAFPPCCCCCCCSALSGAHANLLTRQALGASSVSIIANGALAPRAPKPKHLRISRTAVRPAFLLLLTFTPAGFYEEKKRKKRKKEKKSISVMKINKLRGAA